MTDRTASVAGALEPAGSEDGSAAARATGLVLGLDPDTCLSAVEALASGRVAWVVISGKMAAGKDTIAPHVVDVLPAPTGAGPVFIGYGDLMRADLAGAIDTYDHARRAKSPTPETHRLIRSQLGLRPEHVTELVQYLEVEFAAQSEGRAPSVYDRTENMRRILQELGGAWTTRDDPTYWARKAAGTALAHIASGRSVVLTGARYLPDVELPAQLGAVLLRIDIDRATQLERLSARDGLAPSAATLAALDHPGETALDNWPGFTFRLSNVKGLEETVLLVRQALTQEFARRQTAA